MLVKLAAIFFSMILVNNYVLVKDYSLSVPLKQNALVPQSISGSVVSAANKPNTEEPEPLMEA